MMTSRPFYHVLLSAGLFSIISQGVLLARQISLVTFFGLSRELDILSTLVSILSISIMQLGTVIDNIYVSKLGEIRALNGNVGFYKALGSYVGASFVISMVAVIGLAAIFPVIVLPFVAGFNPSERLALTNLALYSLPWVLLVIPYVALSACAKSANNYHMSFVTDLVVALVSTASIFISHASIIDVPLAFASGYLVGLAILLVSFFRTMGVRLSYSDFPWREFLSRATRHVGSSQIGTIVTFVERFWFSYLPPGGIGALALVQQLTMGMAGLLSFRDAYLVPMANPSGRPKKLIRLILGLLLAGLVVAGGVIALADPLCKIMFEYGKAAAHDSKLIAELLAIGVVGMTLSVATTPVWRLQQMMGIYRPITVAYIATAVSTLLLGYVVVNRLDLGTVGMAMVMLINAFGVAVFAGSIAVNMGAWPSRSNLKMLAQGVLVCGLATVCAYEVSLVATHSALLSLVLGALAYMSIVGVFLYWARFELTALLHGSTR